MRKVLFALTLLIAACNPPTRGAINVNGYQHREYDLKVLPVTDDQIIADGWFLDNYYGGKQKKGNQYEIEYELDANGDGQYEVAVDEYVYELRFKHREHDGVIFLRTIPLDERQRSKRLSVLLGQYVEAVAGAGYELVKLNNERDIVVEKRYAAIVASESDATLADRPAYYAHLEIGNLDRLRLDPDADKKQLVLVLAHTDFQFRPLGGIASMASFPVLLLVGYANKSEEYEEGLPAFRDFLDRIVIDGRHGFLEKTAEEEELGGQASPAPSALGLRFGAEVAEVKAACENSGRTWTDSSDNFVCAGPSQELPLPTESLLKFCDGSLCEISAHMSLSGDEQANEKNFASFLSLTRRVYGPESKVFEIPKECEGRNVACIAEGKLDWSAQWSRETLKLEARAGHKDGGAHLTLRYWVPELEVAPDDASVLKKEDAPPALKKEDAPPANRAAFGGSGRGKPRTPPSKEE